MTAWQLKLHHECFTNCLDIIPNKRHRWIFLYFNPVVLWSIHQILCNQTVPNHRNTHSIFVEKDNLFSPASWDLSLYFKSYWPKKVDQRLLKHLSLQQVINWTILCFSTDKLFSWALTFLRASQLAGDRCTKYSELQCLMYFFLNILTLLFIDRIEILNFVKIITICYHLKFMLDVWQCEICSSQCFQFKPRRLFQCAEVACSISPFMWLLRQYFSFFREDRHNSPSFKQRK